MFPTTFPPNVFTNWPLFVLGREESLSIDPGMAVAALVSLVENSDVSAIGEFRWTDASSRRGSEELNVLRWCAKSSARWISQNNLKL